MSDYSKLIREIKKTEEFSLTKSPRKTTIKLKHLKSGKTYTIHPGNKAVFPLKHWLKQFNR